MYLLDANICIDFMHGHLPYAYDLMRSSDPRLFKIPAIVAVSYTHLVGLLIEAVGWDMAFYLMVPLTVAGAVYTFATRKLR